MIAFGLAVALLVTTQTAPTPADLLRAVHDDFERTGRAIPPEDPALSAAAREVARRALVTGVEEASGLVRLTAAVSAAGGWDPSPTTVVIRAAPEQVLPALEKYQLAGEPASLVGVAIEQSTSLAAVAVVLAQRHVDLDPFPRTLARAGGATHALCGTLRGELRGAELFITRPGGEVERTTLAGSGGKLCAQVGFASVGRHTVELMANGPRGPQIAALFFVDVGGVLAGEQPLQPEPASDADARAQLLVRVNALRLSMGASALKPDAALEVIAQAYATRMATDNFFGHVAPDGADLNQRLAQAGYKFSSAGENLGLASGPLAAHFNIEHSPGHRRVLLERAQERIGFGLALRDDGRTLLVEVLAHPAAQATADATGNPAQVVAAALATERARLRLPRLSRSVALDALAQQHARDALEADARKQARPDRKALGEQVFKLVDEAETVAVDLYVADRPGALPPSKNLANPKTVLAGVGVAYDDASHYGSGKYWIVVIYAGSN